MIPDGWDERLKLHELWLKGHPFGERLVAADANLRGADLRAADLRAADLRAANLTDANLTDANLTGADLTGADLTDADLTDADLRAANLRAANLTDANLTGANLTDADLTGANLTGANLTDADLTGADLTGADLTGADLTDADLTDADLTPIRDDLCAVLSACPAEVAGLRDAIAAGRIDGTTYVGDCACLVGTVANIRGCGYKEIPGLRPNSRRPIERLFLRIRKADTPETNQVSRIVFGWVDDWLRRMRTAFSPAT